MILQNFCIRLLVAFCKFIRRPQQQAMQEVKDFLFLDSLGLTTVYNYYRDMLTHDDIVPTFYHKGPYFNMELADALLHDLLINPSLSSHELARRYDAVQSTIYRYIIYSLGFVRSAKLWVPHTLNNSQKKTRQIMAAQLLKILEIAEKTHFHNIITGDETQIYYDTPRKWEYRHPSAPKGTIPKQTQGDRKVMFTVFFSGAGVKLLHACLPNTTMDGDKFSHEVLEALQLQCEKDMEDEDPVVFEQCYNEIMAILEQNQEERDTSAAEKKDEQLEIHPKPTSYVPITPTFQQLMRLNVKYDEKGKFSAQYMEKKVQKEFNKRSKPLFKRPDKPLTESNPFAGTQQKPTKKVTTTNHSTNSELNPLITFGKPCKRTDQVRVDNLRELTAEEVERINISTAKTRSGRERKPPSKLKDCVDFDEDSSGPESCADMRLADNPETPLSFPASPSQIITSSSQTTESTAQKSSVTSSSSSASASSAGRKPSAS